MNNNRGVYWLVIYNEDYTPPSRHTTAEAARRAAKVYSEATQQKVLKILKMDPVHGPVEIMP